MEDGSRSTPPLPAATLVTVFPSRTVGTLMWHCWQVFPVAGLLHGLASHSPYES